MNNKNWLNIGFWISFAFSAGLAAVYLLDTPLFRGNCSQGPLRSLYPNMVNSQGVFSNNDHSSSLKMLLLPIELAPRRDYTVSFRVNEVKGEKPVTLIVDFSGPDYDFDAQEVHLALAPGTRDYIVTEIINSGETAPATAGLRIFFDSTSSVSISSVSIVGERRRWLRRALFGSLIVFLLFGAWSSIRNPEPMTRFWNSARERKIQAFFVAIFMVLLAAPKLQKEFKMLHYQVLDENRKKIESLHGNPFTRLFHEGDEYSKAFEKYYNDHYGFRDFFIRLKNQIDFSLFNRSDEVVIGRSGYMEYRNVIDVEEIRNERLKAGDWRKIHANIERFRIYLENKGITLILLPIPMKFSVYPEHYPRGSVSRPEKTAFYHLMDYLDSHPEIHYVDASKILLSAKKKYDVFYKTDFHWNEIAAFFVAEETVKTIARLSGRPDTWNRDLRFEKKPGFGGGINRSLAIFSPPLEDRIELDSNRKRHGGYLKPETPYGVHFRATVGHDRALLPATLVVGNSFSEGYFEYADMYSRFSEAYFLHRNHLHELPLYLPSGVRYLVLQFIEVEIGNYFWTEGWWPDYSHNSAESHH